MRLLSILIPLLLAAAPAFADLYQWTDEQGVVHITDSMDKVPQERRAKVRIHKEAQVSPGPATAPAPAETELAAPAEQLYGEQTLEWWRQSFMRKRGEIDEVQSAINSKTQFTDLFEGGRRLGQLYPEEQVARYNLYKEELPKDLRRLAELRDEHEQMQRRARIAGVPREIREP